MSNKSKLTSFFTSIGKFFKQLNQVLRDQFSRWFKSVSFQNFTSSLTAILAGLIVGLIILLITNPSKAWAGFGKIIAGGFTGGLAGIGDILYYATPILLTGLSVGFAFKTGLFNIGAAGQYMVGQFASVYVALTFTGLPSLLHWMLATIAGFIVGALWGTIPGLFKAYLKVNEVITTIMFNYIGMYLVNMIITSTSHLYDLLTARTKNLPASSNIPKMGLNYIFLGSSVNGGIIIAIVVAIIIYIILNQTIFGYELKACGLNQDACKYAGINEKRSIVFSMMIAGGLAGLGGALAILAGSGNHIETIDVLAVNGFNGIPVALLGLSNPIGIIFSALFISHISQGGFYMQLHAFAPEIVDIILSVIIYFSAFALIIKVLISNIRRTRQKRG